MATIIEMNTMFTLTKEAAVGMMADGLLFECTSGHEDMHEIDAPIYHIANTAPDWFGFATIPGTIATAEKAIEDGRNR